tara:strand:- start:118 stop:1104 length:987 start_codon:yes stop_codon:yes gene_type:complete
MKSVLVNGTFRSGSGAINDYLSSRTDFDNPFGDNEFRIISDPTGLNNLYNLCYVNKGLLNSGYGFEIFLNYINNLQKHRVYLEKGVKGKLYNDNLKKLTKQFVKRITKISYYAIPHYKRVNFDIKNKIKYSLGLRFKRKNHEMKFTNIIMPKNHNIFIEESKIYIEKIIKYAGLSKVRSRNIVLNNPIDVLNPLDSTKYFKNPKIIIVTRDPRDIFSSMKMGNAGAAPNYNAKIFVDWFKYHFGSKNFAKILTNKKILHIKFENFLNNFDSENSRLCKFIGVKKKFRFKKDCNFDLNTSIKNISKSKKNLTKDEIRYIEKNLKTFLQW